MIEECYFVNLSMNYFLSARTSSIQTFDSLDFARYSDDGERQVDERVAGGRKLCLSLKYIIIIKILKVKPERKSEIF